MENTITNISVSKTSSYGRFEIRGNVNGEWITTSTNDSTVYDNRNGHDCDTEEELKAHEEAMQYCQSVLSEIYRLKNTNN